MSRVLQRRRPGWLNRLRLVVLTLLCAFLGFHTWAWYNLGDRRLDGGGLHPLDPSVPVDVWHSIGKFSFSGLASVLVGHVNTAAVFCVALVVSLLFVGRFFCGWLCKLGAFQEATEAIYSRIGFRPELVHTRARMVRLFAFVPYFLPVLYVWAEKGLSTSYFNLGAVQPWTPDLPSTVMGSIFYFVVVTFGLTALFGRRAFCRLVCPFALFFQLFEKIPWLPRIRQTGRCIGCDVCDQACPMGISVQNEVLRQGVVTDPECIRCLVCVDVCPVKALKYTNRPGKLPAQQPDLAPVFRESAYPIGVDVFLATVAVIGGVWAATHYTGFFVFLGMSLGLSAGVIAVGLVGIATRVLGNRSAA